MEKRISGLKEKLEELDHWIKENVKSKNQTKPTQNKTNNNQTNKWTKTQPIMEHAGTLDSIKRPNQWIADVEKGKDIQVGGTENTF